MHQPKFIKIINLAVDSKNSFNKDKSKYLAEALYISAKGTKHFYETLEFLSEIFPEIYNEEFEEFSKNN